MIVILYALLVIFSIVWFHYFEFPLWIHIVTTIPLLLVDFYSHYKTSTIAYIYAHRKRTAYFILMISILFSLFIILLNLNFIKLITQYHLVSFRYLVVGILVGLTIRMLLLYQFADIIKAKPITRSKLLMILAWIIVLVLSPIEYSIRYLFPLYLLGIGIGFFIHYSIRIQENLYVQRKRQKNKILNLVKKHKSNFRLDKNNKNNISADDTLAINLFINHKWSKLRKLLDNCQESDLLNIIKISMLRSEHNYEQAIQLLDDIIADTESEYKHIYHLHYAINESDLIYKGQWRHRDKLFANLDQALGQNKKCLLSNAIYALRLANEIDISNTDSDPKKEKALNYIQNALTIYENEPESKLISYLTGYIIPVTYTYLLDIYGYTLLKCNKPRIAKTFLLQSLFQDSTLSSTYIHIAEYYIEYSNKLEKDKSEMWKKSAKVCLLIAIEMEKYSDKLNKGTFNLSSAQRLLEKI